MPGFGSDDELYRRQLTETYKDALVVVVTGHHFGGLRGDALESHREIAASKVEYLFQNFDRDLFPLPMLTVSAVLAFKKDQEIVIQYCGHSVSFLACTTT